MGYEEFEARLLEALQEVYGEDAAVLGERLKCNGVKEKCIYVCPGEGSGIALAVSLGELYGEFTSMGMEACLARVRELQGQLGGCPPDAWRPFGKVQDWELVKKEIYPILLPTEGNGELLGWLAGIGGADGLVGGLYHPAWHNQGRRQPYQGQQGAAGSVWGQYGATP